MILTLLSKIFFVYSQKLQQGNQTKQKPKLDVNKTTNHPLGLEKNAETPGKNSI
jgi:hypothetical protein